jgi:hypothetical protein
MVKSLFLLLLSVSALANSPLVPLREELPTKEQIQKYQLKIEFPQAVEQSSVYQKLSTPKLKAFLKKLPNHHQKLFFMRLERNALFEMREFYPNFTKKRTATDKVKIH